MIGYNVMFRKIRLSREDGYYACVWTKLKDFRYSHPPRTFRDIVGPTLLVRWRDD